MQFVTLSKPYNARWPRVTMYYVSNGRKNNILKNERLWWKLFLSRIDKIDKWLMNEF